MLNDRPTVSKREEQIRRKDFKKTMNVIVPSLATFAILGGIIWVYVQSGTTESASGNEVISRSGIHRHPHLNIIIKGEAVPIPAGIGLSGAVHNPIHTHDPDGVIHLEFEGRVTEQDTTLKKFFDAWGKDFSKDSLLGYGAGTEGNVTMSVNGKENLEFENYHMKDGDIVELKFE
ncbi:MAG: hypothetical protein Q7S11_00205 [bacterium]|nr:hypothetical protein [bacterium]